jgi:hypothetical protein
MKSFLQKKKKTNNLDGNINEKPKKWIEALIWEFLRVWEWK